MVYFSVKKLCDDRSITIRDLERSIGLSNGCISKWKESEPVTGNLKKVADYFGIKLEELLSEGEDDGRSNQPTVR